MDDLVKYEWSLTPTDFIRDERGFELVGYPFTVSGGKLEARAALEDYDDNPGLFIELTSYLECYLDAVQLTEYKPYALRRTAKLVRGYLHVYSPPAVDEYSVSVENVILTDIDGSIIFDLLTQKRREHEELAILYAKHRHDPVLRAMRSSHRTACSDGSDELFHLYEIREEVEAFFGNAKKAREALGISAADWRDFGKICNQEPMPQGRHRGKYLAGKTATSQNASVLLTQARQIAHNIIERYVVYLNDHLLP